MKPVTHILLALLGISAHNVCHGLVARQSGNDNDGDLLTNAGAETAKKCVGKCDTIDRKVGPNGEPLHQMIMRLAMEDHARAKEAILSSSPNVTLARIDGPVACEAASNSEAGEWGFAGSFPCKNVDLLSFISHFEMGSKVGQGNDIWGWTDPLTNREYAIVGAFDGTAFVDVTVPTKPRFLGRLPSASSTPSNWRDIKVYKDHAFIVSEAPQHGVQVFDLTRLRQFDVEETTVETGVTFNVTAYYPNTGRCHNIVINEETGFAYCVGSRNTCGAGLHMIDIRDPKKPRFAGCFAQDGYVHDAQCVVYKGPHTKYQGREICFCYNEDTLTIVDVTDKPVINAAGIEADPGKLEILSRVEYQSAQYTHQGWMTEDQRFLLMDDELDEMLGTISGTKGYTTTYVWNVQDLENPVKFANYTAPVKSADHNLYIRDNFAYESNYASGLRIIDIARIEEASANATVSPSAEVNGNAFFSEVGYFDVRPEDNAVTFKGTWSNYPYFKSGNVIVNSIERGLFVVRPSF
ncbi:hypothetical protein HK102_012670 [Quaeritorhiza haematococci]|nr:hypothetical protein HK102_012670 [Quaeritorhiza haematococci]